MGSDHTFKDLLVWQRSRKMVTPVYELTEKFPSREQFGLMSQIRRCAVPVPSNIAEGHRRGTPREFKQFLTISRGSLAELETQLLISQDLKFAQEKDLAPILQEIGELGRMINSLINSLDT